MIRRIGWPVVTATALGLLLQIGVMHAAAHAFLVSADPSPGAEVTGSPAEIRLSFSEPLEPDSTFLLFAAGFKEITGLSPRIDPEAPEQLISLAPSLSPDTYTVQWTAVSTLDGFESSGTYSFSVVPQNRAIGSSLLGLIPIGVLVIFVIALVARRLGASHSA